MLETHTHVHAHTHTHTHTQNEEVECVSPDSTGQMTFSCNMKLLKSVFGSDVLVSYFFQETNRI